MEKIGNIAAPASAESDSFDAWYKTVQEIREKQQKKQELAVVPEKQELDTIEYKEKQELAVVPEKQELSTIEYKEKQEPAVIPEKQELAMPNINVASLLKERARLKKALESRQAIPLEDHAATVDEWRARELEEQREREMQRMREKEMELMRDQASQDIINEQTKLTGASVEKIMAEEDDAAISAQIKNLAEKVKNGDTDAIVKLQKIKADLMRKNAALEQSHPEIFQNDKPLVAINADITHDMKEMAHDLAERELNAETADGGLIKRIWKGTLFKKFYEQSYAKDYLNGVRTDENGKTVRELIKEQKPAIIERFVLGAVEDSRFIHEKIGKKNEDGTYDDGEKLVPADEKTNNKIREAIENYAKGKVDRGEKISTLARDFRNNISRIMQEAIENGKMDAGSKYTNFLDVAKEAADRYQEIAINARNKAEHDAAMAQVMAGFQVYNADVRSNVRTEAHRDNIDKIINKIESSKIGRFMPPEIVAGAIGAAAALTQTGARAVFGAVGGIIASSALSALKERNRIAEDRARMLRDIASGRKYGNSDDNRISKHEQRIGDTLYDMQSANDLTARIKEAMENKDQKGFGATLMQAIAEARVRIDFSDSEQKDLISYTSDRNRGTERLELDKILIQAERALTEKGHKDYEIMQAAIKDRIINGYTDEIGEYHAGTEEKDEAYNKYRIIASMKRAGKTLGLGVLTYLGSQEIMAVVDHDKIGIFEKLLKTDNNNLEAKETILASGFGRLRGSYDITSPAQITEPITSSNPDEIARLEAVGYKKTLVGEAWSEPRSVAASVDPSASTARVDVKYDGWASGGSGTASIIDGKFVSSFDGNATLNGRPFTYDPSSVKAYITLGDSKFEIAGSLNSAGQMTWGENGVFTTTTGETIKAIGDNGEKLYRYFEVAVDNGVDNLGDGVQHIIPLATDTGANTFSDKITQIVTENYEHPAVYDLVKTIPGSSTSFIRGVDTTGFAFAPELSRTGLGESTSSNPNLRAA